MKAYVLSFELPDGKDVPAMTAWIEERLQHSIHITKERAAQEDGIASIALKAVSVSTASFSDPWTASANAEKPILLVTVMIDYPEQEA